MKNIIFVSTLLLSLSAVAQSDNTLGMFGKPYKGTLAIASQSDGSSEELVVNLSGKAAEQLMSSLREQAHMHRGLLLRESANISCDSNPDGTNTGCQIFLKR